MDEHDRNGHPERNGRADWIAFGDRETQILHPHTASAIFKKMCETEAGRRRFGELLSEVLVGAPPRKRSTR